VACTLKPAPENKALSARDSAWRQGPQVGAFDAFGRNSQHRFFTATPRGGKANYLGVDIDDCFGHAMIEVLRSPSNAAESEAIAKGLASVCDDLIQGAIVSGFAFAPCDDVLLAAAYLDAGFRKSGVLNVGRVGQEGTLLFSRKLADPDRQAKAS
jgi:hypothetical protein